MAQRYSGKYSPSPAANETAPVAVTPIQRLRLMFLLPYLFLTSAFFGAGPNQLFLGLGTFALLTASAWITREGLRAQAEFDARSIARAAPRG